MVTLLEVSEREEGVVATHSSYQLGCLSRTVGWWLVVTLLEVSEREEGVVAIHSS